MTTTRLLLVLGVLAYAAPAWADEPPDAPQPVGGFRDSGEYNGRYDADPGSAAEPGLTEAGPAFAPRDDAGPPAEPQPPAELSPEPRVEDAMARRLAELEAQQQALRSEVEWLRENPARLPAVKATPAGMAAEKPAPEAPPPDEEFFSLDELKAEMKKLTWTKGDFKIVPYGALWADMIYATERTYPGYYTLWVPSAQLEGEDAFEVDCRRTRLGLDVTGPKIPFFWDAASGGKVEIDFTGDGPVNPNRAGVLLRHAYWDVKDEDFRVLVGQTWDVISPLYPGTLNYSVGWDGGNIGYRRCQFRLERYLKFTDTVMMDVQGAIAQDIIPDFATTAGVDRESASWPVFEGRVGWVLGPRGKGCNPISFGVSGHVGEAIYDFAQAGPAPLLLPPEDDVHRRTWSLNADVRIPLSDWYGIQGEFFTGENLSSFLGGIGQGVCTCNRKTIRSTGGWFDVWFDWTERFHTHAGWGLDDPNNNDFFVGRTYNQFIFVNFAYDITKQLQTGLEVTSWKTLYQDTRPVPTGPTQPGESVTFEWMVKYGF
jgi:hypothetical protein